MGKFGFDDSELAKLFADAGAAVKKAKKASHKDEEIATEPVIEPEEKKEPKPEPVRQIPQIPRGRKYSIISGKLEDELLHCNTEEGIPVELHFDQITTLALGRVDNEQLIILKYQGSILYISDKKVSLKGMLPRMGFSVAENWRSLISMLIEKSDKREEHGIKAFLEGGLIPKYPTRDNFLESI